MARVVGIGTYKFLASFIPQHISNKTVIRVYRILAWIKVPRSVREKNYQHNLQSLKRMNPKLWQDPLACIENQAQWGDVRFGAGRHHNMGYSGCEIIAVFNAQKVLRGAGSAEEMTEMIRLYESNGAALWGSFGTSPWAVVQYFKKQGFDVLLSYGEDDTINAIEQKSQVMIATVYNDRYDITRQIHTVCITRGQDGGFVVHNAYFKDRDGTYMASPPYGTLREAVAHISNYQTKLICLAGISLFCADL